MQAGHITRRLALLMPLALAACGGEPEPVFEPLRYTYLPPIQLNVTAIDVEQQFIPAGVPPDVSLQDPASPVEALKAMAHDRLQAFGTANKAVFAIMDAALTRENDVVTGSMAVSLTTNSKLYRAEPGVSETKPPLANLDRGRPRAETP